MEKEQLIPEEKVSEPLQLYLNEIGRIPLLSEEEERSLGERERQVIRLRYGLDDEKSHTLEEIGEILGVTRERVRQIEARALEKLRKKAK